MMLGVSVGGIAPVLGSADPWADRVTRYDPGSNAQFGYDNPLVAIGQPERSTFETTGGGAFTSVVSPFNPAFETNEIVSIGEGGSLTVEFDEPITDSPAHPFGVDLIIFGNGGFIDDDFPHGRASAPIGTFGMDAMRVLVSDDGTNFVDLGLHTEGLFPAMGYLDGGAYDAVPGQVPTDFTRPVDPALTLNDFKGLSLAQIRALYDGSGGGTGIDIAGSGLSAVTHVRIEAPDDGDPGKTSNVEIDAFAAVPEPGAAAMWLALTYLGVAFRRRL
ncbi:MAG: hypothetical protein KDA32_04015 [Phycisphaerales bacterium]|nr:hypothetical protein [Phycisphaerales bacterium]